MLIKHSTCKNRDIAINDIPIGSVFSIENSTYLRLINTVGDCTQARAVALSSNSGVHIWHLNHILYDVHLYPNATLHLNKEG